MMGSIFRHLFPDGLAWLCPMNFHAAVLLTSKLNLLERYELILIAELKRQFCSYLRMVRKHHLLIHSFSHETSEAQFNRLLKRIALFDSCSYATNWCLDVLAHP